MSKNKLHGIYLDFKSLQFHHELIPYCTSRYGLKSVNYVTDTNFIAAYKDGNIFIGKFTLNKMVSFIHELGHHLLHTHPELKKYKILDCFTAEYFAEWFARYVLSGDKKIARKEALNYLSTIRSLPKHNYKERVYMRPWLNKVRDILEIEVLEIHKALGYSP